MRVLSPIGDTFGSAEEIESRINEALPEGLRIRNFLNMSTPNGKKHHSLASIHWGSDFCIVPNDSSSVAEIAATLQQIIETRSLINAKLIAGANSISLRIPNPRSTEESVLHMFERCSTLRPIKANFDIVRKECLARSPIDEQGIVSFEEALMLLQDRPT
jgi:hypothetical protein